MAEPSCVIASVTAIDVEMVQGADAHHDPGFIKAQVHLQVAAPTAESTRPSAAKNSSEDADADADADEDEDADAPTAESTRPSAAKNSSEDADADADADEDEDADDAAARAGTSVAPSTRIGSSFVGRKGKQFVLDGKPFFVHGWNTYWLMSRANDVPGEVERAITDGKKMGLNVCRTWAFYDGKNGLQTSPGVFNETMFKGLDFVIEKAKAQGIRLILTLVNYWAAYGGKNQYVRWSKGDKFDVSKDGTFFTDSKCKQDFKNFMKTVIMRMNTITKVRYRDEPTIFAWELMNEPRCSSDKTGKTLNGWIKEMGSYVKSLDSNHLLGLGSEGFYGPGDRGNTINPPGGWAANQGTDFVEDHKPKEIDFTSAHMYSDHWGFAGPSKFPDALKWSEKWVKGHIEDSDKLGKPFLLGEFGLENKQNLPTISANRAKLFSNVYTWMFNSSKIGGSGVSVLFWQLLTPKLQTTNEDGFGVTIEREPEVKKAIADHAKQLSSIKLSRQAVPIKKTDSERKMNGGDSEEKEGQSLQKVHKEEGQDGISLEEEGSDEGQKKKECVKEEEGMEKGLEEEQKEGGPGRMTEQGRVDA